MKHVQAEAVASKELSILLHTTLKRAARRQQASRQNKGSPLATPSPSHLLSMLQQAFRRRLWHRKSCQSSLHTTLKRAARRQQASRQNKGSSACFCLESTGNTLSKPPAVYVAAGIQAEVVASKELSILAAYYFKTRRAQAASIKAKQRIFSVLLPGIHWQHPLQATCCLCCSRHSSRGCGIERAVNPRCILL